VIDIILNITIVFKYYCIKIWLYIYIYIYISDYRRDSMMMHAEQYLTWNIIAAAKIPEKRMNWSWTSFDCW